MHQSNRLHVFKSRRVRRGLSYQKVTVTDNTGVVFITWFNQDTLPKILTCPQNIYITGRLPFIKTDVLK
jgi:RecG-like helicase